jgi:RNA polymerase sigma-19 factor, ECF subfamily
MPETQQSAGSAAAVFVHHHLPLMQYFLRRVADRQDAKDLVQEVFEQFVRAGRANTAEVIRDPVKYLYGIASHVVYDYLKRAGKQRRRVIVDSEVLDSLNEQLANACPDYLAERLSDERSLERALAGLAPTHRKVLVLTSRDGLSYAEAAQQLGISVATVKKYAHEARVQLRMRWKRDAGSEGALL